MMNRYPTSPSSLNPGFALVAALLLLAGSSMPAPAAEDTSPAGIEPYYAWSVENLSIAEPIGGKTGNAERGRQLSTDRSKGNCIACHVLPIPEAEFPGEIGPPLVGIGKRLSEGEIRLRVVDNKQVNPFTIMPGYYRHPKHLNNVKKKFRGKTVLSAQEIEDLVAYLVTLR